MNLIKLYTILILFFSVSVSYAEFDTIEDFTCIYAIERPFSNSKNLLGHAEYGKDFSLSNQDDFRNYAKILKKNQFFNNWSKLLPLVSQLNFNFFKVPDFVDQVVTSSTQFKFQLKKLTSGGSESDTAVCRGVSTPINQTPDSVLTVAAIIGRNTKKIMIDQEILSSLSEVEQVGLILNLMINAYLVTNTESDSRAKKPFELDTQFKIRMISAMAFDQSVTADSWLNYLNESLQGIKKITSTKELFFWRKRTDLDCYDYSNRLVPTDSQCFLEAIPFYENPTSLNAVQIKKGYLTFDELNSTAMNCAKFEKQYSDSINHVLRDLNMINHQVYGWLGSKNIKDICKQNLGLGTKQIVANGFIFEDKTELCEGYNYHRSVILDEMLMNGAYGAHLSGREIHGSGGVYKKISSFKNLVQNKSVAFDWSNFINWPQFVDSTKQMRDFYNEFKKNQFRCNVDINKAYFLRELEGVN